MSLQTYHQPVPKRLANVLLFLNVTVGLVAGSSLVTNHPQLAAYLTLGAGILNTAVQYFVGPNQSPTHEESDSNSVLSDRRDRVRKKPKTGTPKKRRTEGGPA